MHWIDYSPVLSTTDQQTSQGLEGFPSHFTPAWGLLSGKSNSEEDSSEKVQDVEFISWEHLGPQQG